MKTLFTIAALTLLTVTSFAEVSYRPGAVQADACGINTMVPMSHGTRVGYVSRICKITVQGLNSKAPLYSFEVTSNRGEKSAYVYAQQNLKPIYTTMPVRPGQPLPQGALMMAELKIIGTITNGKYNTIFFVRDPGTVSMVIGSDRFKSLQTMMGNLQVLGDASTNYPVRVDKFEAVYHTM